MKSCYVSATPLLVEIRIDETLWNSSADDRRREWRLLIAELIEHYPPDGLGNARLSVRPRDDEGTILLLESQSGAPTTEVLLPTEALAPHFRSYLDVCHQMTMLNEGSHSARLEALDMAKRVMHDRAAKSLLDLCGSILPDLGTARRFFSLLTSLAFDTSRICGGHRPERG